MVPKEVRERGGPELYKVPEGAGDPAWWETLEF